MSVLFGTARLTMLPSNIGQPIQRSTHAHHLLPSTTDNVTHTLDSDAIEPDAVVDRPAGPLDDESSRRPFAAIVHEHGPAVYRLAKSVVRDSALADDVTQETFISVWKHLPEFRSEGSLRGWILQIAHNQAVSTLRKIRDSATDPGRLPDQHESISTTRVVEGRLAASELVEALDELDELSRAIVVLREVEGFSYEDIATTLGVPIPTVKTRLLRARRTLARRLDGWRGSE